MFQPIENIQAQKKALLKKHRDLEDITIIPLPDSGFSLSYVSAFINKCWDHDYGEEAHITFAKEFIRSHIGENGNSSSLVARAKNGLVGVFLGYDLTLHHNGKTLKGPIDTGLSVDPEYRKNRGNNRTGGIAQYLWISQMECYSARKYDFSAYWLDIRHNKPGNSYHTFGLNKHYIQKHAIINLYGKSLDIEKAVKIGQVKLYEKIGSHLIQRFLPSRKQAIDQMDVIPYGKGDAQACMDFLAQFSNESPARYFKTTEDLDQAFSLHTKSVRVLTLLLKDRQGHIQALIRGFTNPVNNTDAYFQVDQLLFHPDLTWPQKRSFLATCESTYVDIGCFGMVVPENIVPENMLKFGYLPFVKQMLGVNFFNEETASAIGEVEKIRIELR